MTIQPIGPISVALFLTPDDLRPHGLTPQELTRDLALRLTRSAFLQAGMPADGPLEIEAYPDPCGVLLFARLREPEPLWFQFDDLEDLLSAARSLDGELPPETALYMYGDRYWLSLPPEAEQAACRLCEFARPGDPDPLRQARLLEHGALLMPGAALELLLRWFPD